MRSENLDQSARSPGTHSAPDEVIAIGEVVRDSGHGVFQYVSDDLGTGGDEPWLDTLKAMGCPTTYTLAQTPQAPLAYRGALDQALAATAAGAPVTPQVPVRPTGMLYGIQSSFHPFIAHPSYRAIADLSLSERVAKLRDPSYRRALFAESPQTQSDFARYMATNWGQMYRLGDPPDYEPAPDTSAKATAANQNRSPQEVVLEWLLEADGKAFLFSPLGNYHDGDHEALREMLAHPAVVPGASDGGAHCGLICDASFPTYLLTHWARDRIRGPRIELERAVQLQTSSTALAYGLGDRGVLAPGRVADINIIDFDNLHLHAPHMTNDLPAGGRRLLQDVDGYTQTIKSGEVTFEGGEATGKRPGGVLRSGR